jgi:hypothetical protein
VFIADRFINELPVPYSPILKTSEWIKKIINYRHFLAKISFPASMQEADFDKVQRLDDYFFQPVIIGKKK